MPSRPTSDRSLVYLAARTTRQAWADPSCFLPSDYAGDHASFVGAIWFLGMQGRFVAVRLLRVISLGGKLSAGS